MFDQINGLPGHPLIVHGAVVLVPLLCVISIAYAVVPKWRGVVWWAAAALSIAAPAFAWAATSSGDSLATERYRDQIPPPVADHQALGDRTFYISLALGLVTLVFVLLTSERFGGSFRLTRWLSVAMSVVVVVLALVDAYYVIMTGDSGAQNTWGA
ncbi:MAG TPA: DUF2231 domain-containing protein [Micromonosporaceae bacterium]|nr:DUF2231 domain-containing protein [Micromonosporaceae bacterium]